MILTRSSYTRDEKKHFTVQTQNLSLNWRQLPLLKFISFKTHFGAVKCSDNVYSLCFCTMGSRAHFGHATVEKFILSSIYFLLECIHVICQRRVLTRPPGRCSNDSLQSHVCAWSGQTSSWDSVSVTLRGPRGQYWLM